VPNDHDGLRGVVHGKVIQLETEIGLPDGQQVTVTVRPVRTTSAAPGDGLRRSAGAWADDPEGLDAYLEEIRRTRQLDRPGIEP
jgi:hypothetical protein